MKSKPRMLNLVLVFVFVFSVLGITPKPIDAAASDLFISEYIEGSSLNKVIEIYNGTGSPVDLSIYTLELYSNGVSSPSQSMTLTGTLADGDVYIIAHGSADPSILALADAVDSGVINFNGDDTIALRKSGGLVDVFGQIGVDPGSDWGTGVSSTVNNTLRRKSSICQGDPIGDDAFDPSLEWDGFGEDAFDGLGSHSASCGPVEIFPTELFFSEYIEGFSQNKALEIYNGTGSDVDLSDYQVLYYNNGAVDPTITLDLSGNLADGDVLVLSTDEADQAILDEADLVFAYPSVVHYNGDDALALYKVSTTSYVDVIGKIGEDPGTYWGTPPYATAEFTLTRKETVCEGDPVPDDPFDPVEEWDTFPQDTFTYLGSHTTNCTLPEESAPNVLSTNPMNGAENVFLDANIVITFDEPVTVTEPWFDITCVNSGSHTAAVTNNNPEFILDLDADFFSSESCTVTIYAAGITDEDAEDPPDVMEADYSFSFTTTEACGDTYTSIYDIQGDGLATPIPGTSLSTEGVVVGDFQEGGKYGFFIQDLTGDANEATSDGIFVYEPSGTDIIDVNVGDHVRVKGVVSEYYDLTQISTSQVLLCESGVTVPAPTPLSLPVDDELDFEKLEGMLVTIPQNLVISEYFNFDRYGEIMLSTERFMTFTAVNEPDPTAYAASEEEYFLSSITLDDGLNYQNPDPAIHPNGQEFTLDNLFRGGDLVANVTGVLDYAYSLYRIQPTQGADYTPVNDRPVTPDLVEGDLKVASFNVLNYFTTLDEDGNDYDDELDLCGPSGGMECRGADTLDELTRQRDKILAAMVEIDADVFGLMEIENDRLDAPTPDYAVADLVAGLNSIVGAGVYNYIPTGAVGTDAIKQAIIYKPANVTPIGTFKALTSAYDIGFDDTKNRPTLAQVFEDPLTGEDFIVAVNHLKSKGSACEGDPDLGDGAGNCNLTRLAAAEVMVDWLADPAIFPTTDNVLIIGDLNSYDKEDPIDAIKLGSDDLADTGDDYVDLIHQFLGEEAYGYVFDGHIGYLDYALTNKKMQSAVVDVAIWHINADEPDLIDYDMTFKLDAQDALYAPDAYRSSDHDPVIVSLSFVEGPTFDLYLPIIFSP